MITQRKKKKEKRLKNDGATKPGLQDRFSIDAYPGTSRENEIFLHKEAFFFFFFVPRK
jgi:hypothetical protein